VLGVSSIVSNGCERLEFLRSVDLGEVAVEGAPGKMAGFSGWLKHQAIGKTERRFCAEKHPRRLCHGENGHPGSFIDETLRGGGVCFPKRVRWIA
jgi:hypothetical protein